jgi:hypothetical protein
MAERFSHPSTTTSAPLTPTAQVPIEGISHRNKAVDQNLIFTSLDSFAGIFDLENVAVGTIQMLGNLS